MRQLAGWARWRRLPSCRWAPLLLLLACHTTTPVSTWISASSLTQHPTQNMLASLTEWLRPFANQVMDSEESQPEEQATPPNRKKINFDWKFWIFATNSCSELTNLRFLEAWKFWLEITQVNNVPSILRCMGWLDDEIYIENSLFGDPLKLF